MEGAGGCGLPSGFAECLQIHQAGDGGHAWVSLYILRAFTADIVVRGMSRDGTWEGRGGGCGGWLDPLTAEAVAGAGSAP